MRALVAAIADGTTADAYTPAAPPSWPASAVGNRSRHDPIFFLHEDVEAGLLTVVPRR